MSEDLLPQAAVHLNKQLNSGMPTSNPDNERIQRNETYFLFNIPIDMTYPFTSKAQEDHGGLDCAGGPKRLAHGRVGPIILLVLYDKLCTLHASPVPASTNGT